MVWSKSGSKCPHWASEKNGIFQIILSFSLLKEKKGFLLQHQLDVVFFAS